MSITLVDSYPESNYSNAFQNISNDVGIAVAQSFVGNGMNLKQAQFYLHRQSGSTGTVYAHLYAHSGTFGGSSSQPTGTPLATASLAYSSIPTTISLVSFDFDGTYTLQDETAYFIALEFTEGTPSNTLQVGLDNTSPAHPGKLSLYNTILGGWQTPGGATSDVIFYVFGETSADTDVVAAALGYTLSAPTSTITIPDAPTGIYTNFSEYATDQTPNDWSSYWANTPYSVETDGSSAGGKRLEITEGSSFNRIGLAWGDVGISTEQEMLVEFSFNGTAMFFPALRATGYTEGTRGGYALYVRNVTDNIQIRSLVNGSESSDLSEDAFTFTDGGKYRLRFRVNGTTVSFKVWESGDPEPVSWTRSITNATVTTAGRMQLGMVGNSGGTAHFHQVAFADGGDTANFETGANTDVPVDAVGLILAAPPPTIDGEVAVSPSVAAISYSLSTTTTAITAQQQPTLMPEVQGYTLVVRQALITAQVQPTVTSAAQSYALAAPEATVDTQIQAAPTPVPNSYTLTMADPTIHAQVQGTRTPEALSYTLSAPAVGVAPQVQATVLAEALGYALASVTPTIVAQIQPHITPSFIGYQLAAPAATIQTQGQTTIVPESLGYILSPPAVAITAQVQPTIAAGTPGYLLTAAAVRVTAQRYVAINPDSLAYALTALSTTITAQHQPTIDLNALTYTLSSPEVTPSGQMHATVDPDILSYQLSAAHTAVTAQVQPTVDTDALGLLLSAPAVSVVAQDPVRLDPVALGYHLTTSGVSVTAQQQSPVAPDALAFLLGAPEVEVAAEGNRQAALDALGYLLTTAGFTVQTNARIDTNGLAYVLAAPDVSVVFASLWGRPLYSLRAGPSSGRVAPASGRSVISTGRAGLYAKQANVVSGQSPVSAVRPAVATGKGKLYSGRGSVTE